MDELEEIEREDNFRLKTFKRSKIRKEKEKLGGDAMCTCCLRIFDTEKATMPELMLCDICSKVKNMKKVIPKKPVICKNITDEMVQYLDDHLDEIKEWAAASNTENVLMKPCCLFEESPSSSKFKPAPDKLDISFMDKILVETCECPEELTTTYEACLDSCTKPCNVHCSCEAPNQEKEEIITPMPEENKNASSTEEPPEGIGVPPQPEASEVKQQSIEPKTIPSSGPCDIETCIAIRSSPPLKFVDDTCQTETDVCPPCEEPKAEPIPEPTPIEPGVIPCNEPKVEPIPIEPKIKPISGPCGSLTCITERSPPKVVDSPCQTESAVAKPCEEPKVEEPKVEELKAEEPKVEGPKVEEPKVEEPKVEEPKVEKPKVEEPKVEEPKVEPISKPMPLKPCLSRRKVIPCQSKASVSKPDEVTQQPIEPKIKPNLGPCGSLTCIIEPSSLPAKAVDEPSQTEPPVPDLSKEPVIKPILEPSTIKSCIIEPEMPPPCVSCQSKASMSKPCEITRQPTESKIKSMNGPCGLLSCHQSQRFYPQPNIMASKTGEETLQSKESKITPIPEVSCNPCIAELEIPSSEEATGSKPCKDASEPIKPEITQISESCGLETCTKKSEIVPVTEPNGSPKLDKICITCQSKASEFIPQPKEHLTQAISEDTSDLDKCKETTTQTIEQQSDQKPSSNVMEQANLNHGGYVEKIIEITKTKNIDGTIQIEKKITIKTKNVRLKSRETLSKTVSEYDDQNITIDSNSTFTDQSRSRICSSCMPSGDIYVLCSCSQSQQSDIDKDEELKKVSETQKDDQTNKEPTKTSKIDAIKSDQNIPCCQMYDPKMRSCISDHVFESKTMKIAKNQMSAVDDNMSSETVASATGSKPDDKGKNNKNIVGMCLVSFRRTDIPSQKINKSEIKLKCNDIASEYQDVKQTQKMVDFTQKPKCVESNIESYEFSHASNILKCTNAQNVGPAKYNKNKKKKTISKIVKPEVNSKPIEKTTVDLKTIKIADFLIKTSNEHTNYTFETKSKAISDLSVPFTSCKQNKTIENYSEVNRTASCNDIMTRLAMCKECLMELTEYVPTRNNLQKMPYNCKYCQLKLKKQAIQKEKETSQQSRNYNFYPCTSVLVKSYSHISIDVENSHISIKLKKSSYFPKNEEKQKYNKKVLKENTYVKEAVSYNLPDRNKTNIQLNFAHNDIQTEEKQTETSDCIKKKEEIRYLVVSKNGTDRIANKIEKKLQVDSLLSELYKGVLSSSICSMERPLYHDSSSWNHNTLHKKHAHCRFGTYLDSNFSENSLPDDNKQNSSKYKTSFELKKLIDQDKNISTTQSVSSPDSSFSFDSSCIYESFETEKASDNTENILNVESYDTIMDQLLSCDIDEMYKPSTGSNIVESSYHIRVGDNDSTVKRHSSLVEEKEDCIIDYEDCKSCADCEKDFENYKDACVECKESNKDSISKIWCQTPLNYCCINNEHVPETQSREVCTNNIMRDREKCSKRHNPCNIIKRDSYICKRVDACTNTKQRSKL